ncbi:hypothetical protein [Vogesella indigofera]|uniref:hypothetical protein n=1 Tax=Vogesella indigofera TaxID=45465 RepID=UPI00234F28FB|nr:hypothetical protein [Vogesella indigofera]MDC7710840.1 hypothetical protein [Vogesella indigofera]
MKVSSLIGMSVLMLATQAQAGDIRDQMNIQTGKAELIVPGMAPQQVAEQVKDALTQFAIPANLNFHLLPSPLPSRPGSPSEKQLVINGAPATDYVCGGAYAEITKTPPPVQNAFYYNRELLHSCLYAFQGGVKIDIVFHIVKSTESLTSSIFNGITKAIRGSDGERITSQLKENITEIKKNLPTLLVSRIEAPGMPIQEPDKEAVAKIIPPQLETKSATGSKQDNSVAAAPAQMQSAVSQPTSGVDLSFVGARKELTAMGFKFYDQDQFVDAARRNDFLTVRLFLAAGSIRPSAPDSNGQTALNFANKNREMKFFLTAFVEAEKQGKYPGNISDAVFAK